jgi:hypothetical protein
LGAPNPTGYCQFICDPGNWLSAIGYFALLDLIGSTFNDVGEFKNPDNQNSIEFAIKSFGYVNSPGKDKESNWLPSPAGEFSIWIRAYWSDQAILDGTWKPPTVTKVK